SRVAIRRGGDQSAVDMADLAVPPDDAVGERLRDVRFERRMDGSLHPITVVRVDHLAHQRLRRGDLARLETVDAVDLFRPPHIAGGAVPLQVAEARQTLGFFETTLVGPELVGLTPQRRVLRSDATSALVAGVGNTRDEKAEERHDRVADPAQSFLAGLVHLLDTRLALDE